MNSKPEIFLYILYIIAVYDKNSYLTLSESKSISFYIISSFQTNKKFLLFIQIINIQNEND
jgi:hypothetical protein